MNDFNSWKMRTSRQRALWPGSLKGYCRRQYTVTLSLDADLAEWVVTTLAGRSSFTCDLEETVITALRIAKGELPADALPLRRPSSTGDEAVSP